VQRVRLIGLLREKALAQIFAVTRLAVLQPHHAKCLGIRGDGAGSFDLRQQSLFFGHWREYEKSRAARRAYPCYQACAPFGG